MIVPADIPELAPYLDEPKQLQSGSIGKDAFLHLRFETREEKSILDFMQRRAPLLVQRALYCDEGMPILPVVFIITNSGGILQGDRYRMEFVVQDGACAHITTQAATKIHEMDANFAIQTQELTLGEDAYLEYLPDQTIPFRNSRFLNRTEIRLHRSATLLYGEILVSGRQYYKDGERFAFDLFSSSIQASYLNEPIGFVEKLLIEPAKRPVRPNAAMGDFDILGNMILLTPKALADQVFDAVQPDWDRNKNLAWGASRLPGEMGLILKVLGKDTETVRAKLREFWAIVRPVVTGFEVSQEFAWR